MSEAIRFGIEKSDYVTAVSQSLIEQTNEVINPNKSIHAVYNFIDDRVYRKMDSSHLRTEYEIADNEKVVIHVSNFRSVKRVQDVVKTFENRHSCTCKAIISW